MCHQQDHHGRARCRCTRNLAWLPITSILTTLGTERAFRSQLLDCVSLNRAYQDVLDFLDEGVDRDSITASQYMRVSNMSQSRGSAGTVGGISSRGPLISGSLFPFSLL